jgi:hypothetical protein
MPVSTLASTEIVPKSELENYFGDDKKNYIGEKIYPYIESWYSENAPRITGMIIDMDESDLLPALESEEALKKIASEGYELLISNPEE